MAQTSQIVAAFAREDAVLVRQMVEKARKETDVPNLSVSAAIMRLVRREMGQ